MVSMVVRCCSLWALVGSLLSFSAQAIQSVHPIQTPSAPASSSSSCHGNGNSNNMIFGVPKRLPSILSMRGGAVLEPETLQDVESILLKAGSEQKLVVIDFSATW